ncbi:hypothetical protein [Amphritea sp.]|uniref:hypothetical protein n=1 Tax=Amphritea sp. TaxID=1872502 RepID=UPI003D150DBC
MLLRPLVSLVFSVLALVCTIAAMTAFLNNDGISTTLAGRLTAPIQSMHEPSPWVLFKVGGRRFGEDEAICITMILASVFDLVALIMCIIAASHRQFRLTYGVTFLLSVSAFALGFFNLRHLINA